MVNYNIIMGQGITVPRLDNIGLVTGPGKSADQIQSCAAVVFYNTVSHAAGLYHYPSGDINKKEGSQAALKAMCRAVEPNEGYISYGVVDYSDMSSFVSDKPRVVPSDPHNMKLRSFVLGLLPMGCRLRRMPASKTKVTVLLRDNKLEIDNRAPSKYIDLRDEPAGATSFGHIYWDE